MVDQASSDTTSQLSMPKTANSAHRRFLARLFPRTAGAIKIACATSLMVLLTILGLVGFWSYRGDVRDAEREVRESARAVAAQIGRVVEAGNLLLLHQQDMANAVDMSDPTAVAEINTRLQHMVAAAPYVFRLFMINEKGDVYASSMAKPQHLNAADREYFKAHQAGLHGLHISSVLRSQATGEAIVILSRRVSGPHGEFRGVVLVSFELDALRHFAQQIVPKRRSMGFQVIGPGMQILIDTTPADRVGKRLTETTQGYMRIADSSMWRYAAVQDVPRIWAHEHIDEFPLYVRVGIESAEVFNAWSRAAAPYVFASFVILFLLTGLSVLAIRHAQAAEYARRGLDLANRDLERRVQNRTAELHQSNIALRDAVKSLETINATNANLAAELDLEKIVQATTDAGVALTGAAFGAFFYNRTDEQGESYTLYSLSGASREAFAKFPMPRNTAVFGPTFRGEGVVRSDDIIKDPRYGKNQPYRGMPPGHLPVRSYLAVPVISRAGEVLGGLFFGHPEPGIFTEQHENLVAGMASQTAVAMDNASLFEAAQREIQRRRRMEDHQALLLKELSHRVKNSLAVVQAIANQTLKNVESPQAFVSAFRGRLMALGKAHDLLSQNDWRGASLRELLVAGLAPFAQVGSGRIALLGEDVLLHSDAAPALAMVVHELATNAAKYGSLSVPSGSVCIEWTKPSARPDALAIVWMEKNGPPLTGATRRGFGLTFIERVVEYQLDGEAILDFPVSGLRCAIEIPLGGSKSALSELAASGV